MSTRPLPVYNEDVRKLLKQRGEPVDQDVRVEVRPNGTIRATLLRTAFEDLDPIPEVLTEWYDPNQHAIVIPLPERSRPEQQLEEF